MKLIDKSTVVAEIGRLKTIYKDDENIHHVAKYNILVDILSFLDTLEVKEIDLGQEIKNRMDSLSNLYCYMEDLFNGTEEEGIYPIPEKVKNELSEFAKHFFELGLKAHKGG